MAKEITKTETSTAPSARPSDPFSAMRAEMERVFDNFMGPRGWGRMPDLFSGNSHGLMSPSVDIRENEKAIIVEAELPGMEQDDVDITLRDGVLSIKGEKKSERTEKKDDYHVTERNFGSFHRSFSLPDTVDDDKIAATLENGVLLVTLPKRPEAVKAEKKISIGNK